MKSKLGWTKRTRLGGTAAAMSWLSAESSAEGERRCRGGGVRLPARLPVPYLEPPGCALAPGSRRRLGGFLE